MNINFLNTKETSCKYLVYAVLKSSNDEGVIDFEKLVKIYGISDALHNNQIKDTSKIINLIKNIKVAQKQTISSELLLNALLKKPLPEWNILETSLEKIFDNIYESSKDVLENKISYLKNNFDVTFIKKMENIFSGKIGTVNVFLVPGGLDKFATGLAIDTKLTKREGVEPIIFVSCSNVGDDSNVFIESTIAHEILHIIENSSDVNLIAKECMTDPAIFKLKPSNISHRSYIFEILITAIAGNKHSYHIKKYYPDLFTPYIEPEVKNSKDIDLAFAHSILPEVEKYLDNNISLDKLFFENISVVLKK